MKIKRLCQLGALILLAVLGGLGWLILGFYSPNRLDEPFHMSIEPGQGINSISKRMFDEGIIHNTFVFETYIWLRQMERSVQAGVYEVPAHANIVEITRLITSGEVVEKENQLQLIEGWTVSQIAAEVDRQTDVTAAEFLKAADRIENDAYGFLSDRPTGAGLEGFLFPDTYRVYRQTTPEEILEKLLKNFDRKWSVDLRENVIEAGRGMFDVVTMASILEREVKSLEDKRNASDIFWKRLDAGVALQSDATVNYVTGKKTIQVSNDDLEVDSLYNTYRYPGLPPGPISNPGLDSLTAAADPNPNEFFYFLTTPDGRTVFSRTLEEHNQNKEKFLK